jgi:hypothetical protein
MKEIANLCLFIFIIFILYLVFQNFHYNPLREGMTDASGASNAPENGIAGNAAAYGAGLKAATIKLQDTFLITKYRSDYENVILNLDDLISNMMLKTTLSYNQNNPGEAVDQLVKMQQAKTALNSVMKFLDSQ